MSERKSHVAFGYPLGKYPRSLLFHLTYLALILLGYYLGTTFGPFWGGK